MSTLATITCPSTCSTVPAAVEFDFCNPSVHFGEIEKIYVMARDATALTDWTDASEWATRIDNTGVTGDEIRELHVSADLPAPEREMIDISVRRKTNTPATFTINLDIDDLTDENYDFMRTTACNTEVVFWYATKDHVYGGNSGITGNIIIDNVIERGVKSLQKFTGTITWEGTFEAQRTTNIIE